MSNGQARHAYSKRQPWNADQTRLEIAGRIVDADDYSIVSRYMPLTSERVWSNTDPELIYGIEGSSSRNTLSAFNVNTGVIEKVIILSGYSSCSIGAAEGSLSINDQYVLLACRNSNNQLQLLSVDLQSKSVIGRFAAKGNFNWGGFSQSGEFVVIENNRYPDPNPELYVLDKTLGSPRYLGRPEHGDFGIDANGDEVYAMIDYDVIRYIRLKDSKEFEVGISSMSMPIGNGHLSCRNVWRQGWCYFSSSHHGWLGAIYLSDSENSIEYWGYHRSNMNIYNAQPHPVPNRAGDKLLFSSNWYGKSEISDYVISVK